MYAFAILVTTAGIALVCAALAVGVISVIEGSFLTLVCSVVILAAGVPAAWWGISTSTGIDREQCEAAGFEWITGSCYGSNVNVNG